MPREPSSVLTTPPPAAGARSVGPITVTKPAILSLRPPQELPKSRCDSGPRPGRAPAAVAAHDRPLGVGGHFAAPTSLHLQPRIEDVAQPVAEQVHPEHGEHDAEP